MSFLKLNFLWCFLVIFSHLSKAVDESLPASTSRNTSINDLPPDVLYKIISLAKAEEIDLKKQSYIPDHLSLFQPFSAVSSTFKNTLEEFLLPQIKSFLPHRVFLSQKIACLQNKDGYSVCWNYRPYYDADIERYGNTRSTLPINQIWVDLSEKIGLIKKITIQELNKGVLFCAITEEDSLKCHVEHLTEISSYPKALRYLPEKFLQPSSLKDIYLLDEGSVGCALRKSDSKIECWGDNTFLEEKTFQYSSHTISSYDDYYDPSFGLFYPTEIINIPIKEPTGDLHSISIDSQTYYGGLKHYISMRDSSRFKSCKTAKQWADWINDEWRKHFNPANEYTEIKQTSLYPSENLNSMKALALLKSFGEAIVGIEENTGFLKILFLNHFKYKLNEKNIWVRTSKEYLDSNWRIAYKSFEDPQSIHGNIEHFCILNSQNRVKCRQVIKKFIRRNPYPKYSVSSDRSQYKVFKNSPKHFSINFFEPTLETCTKLSIGGLLGCALKQKDQFLSCWLVSPYRAGFISTQDIDKYNPSGPHYKEVVQYDGEDTYYNTLKNLKIIESIGPVVDFEILNDVIMMVKTDGSVFMLDVKKDYSTDQPLIKKDHLEECNASFKNDIRKGALNLQGTFQTLSELKSLNEVEKFLFKKKKEIPSKKDMLIALLQLKLREDSNSDSFIETDYLKAFNPSSEIGTHPNIFKLQNDTKLLFIKKHLSAIKHNPLIEAVESELQSVQTLHKKEPKIFDYAMLWMVASYIKKIAPDLHSMSLANIHEFCKKSITQMKAKDFYTLYAAIQKDIKNIFSHQPHILERIKLKKPTNKKIRLPCLKSVSKDSPWIVTYSKKDILHVKMLTNYSEALSFFTEKGLPFYEEKKFFRSFNTKNIDPLDAVNDCRDVNIQNLMISGRIEYKIYPDNELSNDLNLAPEIHTSNDFRNVNLRELMIAGHLELKKYLHDESSSDLDLAPQMLSLLKEYQLKPNDLYSFTQKIAYELQEKKESVDQFLLRYNPKNYLLMPYFFYDALIKNLYPNEDLAYFLSLEVLVRTVQKFTPLNDFFAHQLPSWDWEHILQKNIGDNTDAHIFEKNISDIVAYQKYLGLDQQLNFFIERILKTDVSSTIFLQACLNELESWYQQVIERKHRLIQKESFGVSKNHDNHLVLKFLKKIEKILFHMIVQIRNKIDKKGLEEDETLIGPSFGFNKRKENEQKHLKVYKTVQEIKKAKEIKTLKEAQAPQEAKRKNKRNFIQNLIRKAYLYIFKKIIALIFFCIVSIFR